MDIIKQYEIAFSYDCYGPYIRLIRLAGLAEADIQRRERQIVVIPDAVREAYRPLYARGTAIVALAVETRGAHPEAAVEAAREEVLQLLDHMKRGGL